MKAADPATVVEAYRDLALFDRDDELCGMVDDVECAERERGVWEMTALLVGPGAWGRRRPRWLTRLLPGHRLTRVDAADVASTGDRVRLLKRADQLGLAPFEQKLLRRFGTN
ncbi:MAG: hypothetical protein ACTHKM_04540 [Tsuneonella sp.]